MERPPGERAGFVAQACADDPELRREVESLLAHEGQAGELRESPARNRVSLPNETATFAPGVLAAGAVLAEYRIAGKLGAGGMGEVYRAIDTKLQREVALKVLPAGFAHDAAWLSRFQREARVLASLNHPHIAAIYGLEESGGVCAIAMELVEGPTLAERLEQAGGRPGRIPIPEALAIAKQIAEALEYAHEKGVIHRDLKPANIKVRPDGVVKVLDFGLAKAMNPTEMAAETATRAGVIMGTPAYMPPEQAGGLPVDRRADIWPFGVVLFEMLAGRQIYARKTTLETLAAVARDEPQWDELPAETPAAIRRLLRRCLDKDPKRRLRDIGEARIALEDDQPEEGAQPSTSAWRWRARAGWIAAAAFLGLAAGAGLTAFLRTGAGVAGADWKLSIVPPPGTELPSVGSYKLATPEISPDGTMIVCRLGEGLQLRKLNSTGFIPLRGTTDAEEPFWAPDSQWIGFFVNGALMKMQVPDGAPELLSRISDPVGGAWSRGGTILAATASGLLTIPAAGGSATKSPVPKPGIAVLYPHFLPDGEHFLFFTAAPSPSADLYLGGWKDGKWTLPPVMLKANSGETRYSPAHGGAVLFVQNDNLYSQKLNLAQARLEGSPMLVETLVSSSGGAFPDTASFSVSANGVLAWRPGRPYEEQLTWFDRLGNAVSTAGPPCHAYLMARLSPDERRIAALVWTPGGLELRVLETGQSGFLTILSPEMRDLNAVIWRHDSLHLLYTSMKSGESFLMERSATGSSEVRQLGKLPPMTLQDMAPDGTLLGMIHYTLHVVPWEGDRTPRPLLASEEQTRQGAFSPDGHWVVYASVLAQELFVQQFPISGPRRQISKGGGAMPYWRGDGKEIVYLGPDRWVYSVRSDPTRGEFLPPERLFAVRIAQNSPSHFTLAATRDGSRILFDQAIDQPESRVITVAFHR